MKVRLLKSIVQNGGIKASIKGDKVVAFVEGAEVYVSDATGQKYIDAGIAEEVLPAPEEQE